MFRKVLLLALLGLAVAAPSSKIHPKLTRTLKANGASNVFVRFHGGNTAAIQRTGSLKFTTRGEKITNLASNLKSLTAFSQKSALALLQARSADFKQFWVSNELYVKNANADLVNEIAALPEVAEVRQELILSLEPLTSSPINPFAEWNIEKIEAPGAWVLPGGNNGEGAVVANIDTGVRGTHEALKDTYRTSRGWFDPYYGDEEPGDDNGHGTHTMGTMAGNGGIGVAPGATWIACRGCGSFACGEAELKACGQWVVCPTEWDGSSEDCDTAPNVVSNSWGGGQGNAFYNAVIDAWHAADIIPVFAIGNSGPSCGSANSPGDQNVIAVGSTTNGDTISGSSSAGPSVAGQLKPDISAPGNEIRSAWSTSDTAYQVISGTSMATPHVAGTAALLLARNPNLTYAQVKDLLQDNADRNLADTGAVCGGIPSTTYPNNQYGHGRVNARKSLEAAISG